MRLDFCSEKMLEGWKKDKSNTVSADELLDQYIDLYNDCIGKAPADSRIPHLNDFHEVKLTILPDKSAYRSPFVQRKFRGEPSFLRGRV